MGCELVCVNETLSCSYTIWHKIRMNITGAVIKFMKQRQLFQDINDDTIFNFDDYMEIFFHKFDLLEDHGLEGIFFLLMIPDTTGIYNVENSISIMRMLNIVHDFIPTDLPYYQNLLKLFQESIDKERYIMVT